ncbi:MAG: hypothetical protein IJX55_06055 [Clostridia bacterium]|nr:hypothetical protein [Clostridia bacterium]
MNCYRVSKYNPLYRKNGVYTRDEWTSYSDIGKIYGGKAFAAAEYEETESNYIQMLLELLKLLEIEGLKILCLEKYEADLVWRENELLDSEKAAVFAADCLREKCWGKLTARGFVWKTGYDFYMYFACDLMPQTISDVAKKYGLYTDKCEYNDG